ncbi:hypothetical protein I302_103058 [Kwoniella bestiolae CBS 10118]|uniref:Uncharacterized protein n=1 Tax=Kwoniella bestiolae CBS 10118 TaxID=1296100 RepID=A0A1B9GGZ8_9TREE|nr:hypothetical protein I302_01756 [Kwoniella bestiolae CBS 10118]OCF30237.1 hypothetical protein I302_01756 [Kwoniella bestiolae CBS 10118]
MSEMDNDEQTVETESESTNSELTESQLLSGQAELQSSIAKLENRKSELDLHINAILGTGYLEEKRKRKAEVSSQIEFFQAVLKHGGTHTDASDYLRSYYAQNLMERKDDLDSDLAPPLVISRAASLASRLYMKDLLSDAPEFLRNDPSRTHDQRIEDMAYEGACQVAENGTITTRIEELAQSPAVLEWIANWAEENANSNALLPHSVGSTAQHHE